VELRAAIGFALEPESDRFVRSGMSKGETLADSRLTFWRGNRSRTCADCGTGS